MSKGKRKTDLPAAQAVARPVVARPALDDRPGDPLAPVLWTIAVALLAARWLIPTESAAEGDTLWIVQLWLGAVILWTWRAFRHRFYAVRLGWFDAAFWMIVAGHALSTAVLWSKGINRRAALDVCWEWVGLGSALFVLRQVLQTPQQARRLVSVFAVLGVVLAGFGIWQHYEFYPRARAEYESMQSELARLQAQPGLNATRIRELQFQMQGQGIPTDEAGRLQYENRLRFSNEPFGPFALANTFAGVLLVSILFGAELARSSENRRTRALWIAALLIEVYCLVLTKGRTAWIGLFVGGALWGASLLAGRFRISRRAVAIAAASVLIVAVLVGVAALGGGFDVQVISEAPKSLSYRLQYWKASGALLRARPWFGTGPGNFRHPYLQYKLPESSEEIADPHNLVLDLWANGGLAAVAGLVCCLVLAIASLLRRVAPQPRTQGSGASDRERGWRASIIPAATGFAIAFLAPVVSGTGDFDVSTLVLFAGWLLAFSLLRPDRDATEISHAALAGAAVGRFIHLLGSGGIEMPAIVQCFLVLAAVGSAKHGIPKTAPSRRGMVGAIGGAAASLFVCCLITATLPVLNRRAMVASGDQAFTLNGNLSQAIGDYRLAAIHDPFSPEPLEKLSNAYFAAWKAETPQKAETSTSTPEKPVRPYDSVTDPFQKGMAALQMAIDRDPKSPGLYQRRGEMYALQFSRNNDPRAAAQAVDAFQRAVTLYPNDSALRFKLAAALLSAKQPVEARTEARRALALDEINHANSHTDRYLPAATVEELIHMAASGK